MFIDTKKLILFLILILSGIGIYFGVKVLTRENQSNPIKCPSGQESCVNNTMCCQDDEQCVQDKCCKTKNYCEGKCCPNDCDDNGNCCPDDKPINYHGECCSKDNSCGTSCCPKPCEGDEGNKQCCPHGTSFYGGKCCIKTKQCENICCPNDCDDNGKCCPDDKPHAYKGVCCALHNSCGTGCCPEKCCKNNTTCCSDGPEGTVCYNDTCCNQAYACGEQEGCCPTVCCNGQCCDANQTCIGDKCCPNENVFRDVNNNPICCPDGTKFVDNRCCPVSDICNDKYCCLGNTKCYGGKCCPDGYRCAPPGVDNPTGCCSSQCCGDVCCNDPTKGCKTENYVENYIKEYLPTYSCIDKCGDDICNNNESCWNNKCCSTNNSCGTIDGRCCPTDCCSGECCDDLGSNFSCYKNECCAKELQCGDSCCTTKCCETDGCCPNATDICVNGKCCSKNSVADNGSKCCGPNQVVYQGDCCDSNKACADKCCDTACCGDNKECCNNNEVCHDLGNYKGKKCMVPCGEPGNVSTYCDPDEQTCINFTDVNGVKNYSCYNKGSCTWGDISYNPAGIPIENSSLTMDTDTVTPSYCGGKDKNDLELCKTADDQLVWCNNPDDVNGPFSRTSTTVVDDTRNICTAADCYKRINECGLEYVSFDGNTCRGSFKCETLPPCDGTCPLDGANEASCCKDDNGKYTGVVCDRGQKCVRSGGKSVCVYGWKSNEEGNPYCDPVTDNSAQIQYITEKDCMNGPEMKLCSNTNNIQGEIIECEPGYCYSNGKCEKSKWPYSIKLDKDIIQFGKTNWTGPPNGNYYGSGWTNYQQVSDGTKNILTTAKCPAGRVYLAANDTDKRYCVTNSTDIPLDKNAFMRYDIWQ